MNRKSIIITISVVVALLLSASLAFAKPESKKSKPIDGSILVGVNAYCSNVNSEIHRSFNNVNDFEISISSGASLGYCTIDFGFDVSDRYIMATVTHPDTPLGVTVSAPPWSGDTTVTFFVWHAGNGAAFAGGNIFVIVY